MGHGASSIFWYGDKYQEQKFHIWDPKWVYLKNTLSHFCYVKNFAWSTAWSDGIFLERIWGGFDLAEGLFWQWIKALEWLGGTGGGRVTCASRVSLFLFSGEVQGLSSNSSRHPPAQSSSQALFLLSCSNPGKYGYKPNMYLSVTVPGKGQAQDTSTKDIPSPSSVPITDTKHWDADVALGAWKAVYPMFSSWVTKSSLPFPSCLEGPSLKCPHSSWATSPCLSQPHWDRAGAGAGLLSPGWSHTEHTSWTTIPRSRGFPVLHWLFQNPPSNSHTENWMALTFNSCHGNFGTSQSIIFFPVG